MATVKTPFAARRLRVTYHRIVGLIRFGKIQPPEKDSSGDYVWTEKDLRAAAEALRVPMPTDATS